MSLVENDDFVTETLAKIYHNQKNYERALKAYQQLILKIPKKKSFFAAQIEFIKEELKQSKK
jgi:tetratricopeptide (TPR) repeat protein